MHWWGGMLQSLRETCPFAKWREGCKYGQEDEDACRDWCAWHMDSTVGRAPVCRQGSKTWGTRGWMHIRVRYWGWGQL